MFQKSDETEQKQFKAKPATVLYKKPFEPKKEDRLLTEISEFKLNTDQRAKEREDFDLHLKEKEKYLAMAKEMHEKKKLQEEEEERIRIRKAAEIKAQPIKKYKEVKIVPSGKITEPISPNFQSKRIAKKQNCSGENKENSK